MPERRSNWWWIFREMYQYLLLRLSAWFVGERMDKIKFLGTDIAEDLYWTSNTITLVKA